MLDNIETLNLLPAQKKKRHPHNLMDELYPEIPSALDITEQQRTAIENLDLSNRRYVIRALMKQQGLLDTAQQNNDVLSQARGYLNPYTALENTEPANNQNIDEKSETSLREKEAEDLRRAYHHDEVKSDTSNDKQAIDDEHVSAKSDATAIMDKNNSTHQLGALSSKYESLKNPAAIGYDNGGGYSYGVFQIETKHGTMKDFLSYLEKNEKYQDFAQKLQSSGGYAGALNKANNFVSAWKELAKNQDFIQSQYQFIFDMKFKPLLRNVAQIEGFDIEKRHPVIKDVLFSIAVQHGQRGAFDLIKNALGSSAKNLDDEALINKLYDERSKVDKYLATQPSSIRKNAKNNRYPNERKDALKALKE